MADQAFNQCSSSSNALEETPDSTLELNIKTLDSQTYTLRVNKNILVSLFKEKIANEVGIPVGQQRLIFRGRVLKDDHPLSEYHLENGHTLHLVVRQSAESRSSPDAGSGETTTHDGNQGNDTNGGAPRNRVGQISHSVVLGTFNVGDQGESVVPDLSRVIGAVLNSFGIGSQPTNNSNGTQSSIFSNVSGQVPPGIVSDGTPAGISVQSQAGNNSQSRQTFSGQPFQSLPQVVQIPVTAAAAAIPIPSVHAPIPDSLDTLLEFIIRMEQALSQNGYQPHSSAANSREQPRAELPRHRRGPSTPEALSVVLRNAQHLLSGQAITALSHIAGRLEQEGASSDPTLRGQIQTEAMQVGLAMQHLGALLLELGRTILTLRMGQSPAESYVNAGPAVYISSSGPNPLMVQPFPLQTSSLFSGTAAPLNPVTVGPVGIGTAPRHINIHIHAGTSLSPMVSTVGNLQSTGNGGQGDSENNTGPAGSSSVRVLPALDLSSQSRVSAINARLREQVNNVQAQNHGESGTESSERDVFGGPGVANATNEQPSNAAATVTAEEPSGLFPERSDLMPQSTCNKEGGDEDLGRPSAKDIFFSTGESSTPQCGESTSNSVGATEDASLSKSKAASEAAMVTPLGLGLGGLERKRRSKQPKPSVKNEDSGPSAPPQGLPENSGQKLLESLLSGGSASNRPDSDETRSRQQPSGSRSGDGSDDRVDVSTAVSQVLENPALDGLLGGISRQTGVGSPNVLRNMMQQLTSNPQIMNTVQQIAQQVDGREIENMMSGGAQGGGLDFSRILQQMMPLVSRAFSQGGPLTPSQHAPSPQPAAQPLSETASGVDDQQTLQVNVQPVAQAIEHSNAPGGVFRAIVENAIQIPIGDSIREDLMSELCRDEDLAHEYAELLRRDIQSRFQGDLGP